MSNENSKKVVLGVVIAAVVGASTLYFINAARAQKTPILHKIGKTICEVGEALENCEIESLSDVAKEVQNALPKSGDALNSILDWISSGVHVLQKLKKGG